jgi:hypothetical protein
MKKRHTIQRLKLTDVPTDVSSWQDFALTFDGYKYHGSLKACAAIANRKNPKTLNDYRTCLFFEQRRWYHNGKAPEGEQLDYVRSLLAGIRKLVDESKTKLSSNRSSIMKKSGLCTPRLRCLRPVLSKWIGHNLLLVRHWEDVHDVPWWYNERASLSVFAGAVWQTGDYAFEEYALNKVREDKPVTGRVDLEFSIANRTFIAEAKQCWLPNMGQANHANRIKKSIAKATADVRLCRDMGMRKLAIVFGVPYMDASTPEEEAERVDKFLRQAREIEVDAMAWVFPGPKFQTLLDDKVYPGVVVWLNEVK